MKNTSGNPESVCAVETECPISDTIAKMAINAAEIHDSSDRLATFKELGKAAKAAEKICRACRMVSYMRGYIAPVNESAAINNETIEYPDVVLHEDPATLANETGATAPDIEDAPSWANPKPEAGHQFFLPNDRKEVQLIKQYFIQKKGEHVRPRQIVEHISNALGLSESAARQRWNKYVLPSLVSAGLITSEGYTSSKKFTWVGDVSSGVQQAEPDPTALNQTIPTPEIIAQRDPNLSQHDYAEEPDQESLEQDLTELTDWGLAVSKLPDDEQSSRQWVPSFYIDGRRLLLEWDACYTLLGLANQPDGIDAVSLFEDLQHLDHRLTLKKVRSSIGRCEAVFALSGNTKAIVKTINPDTNATHYALAGRSYTENADQEAIQDFLAHGRPVQ